MVIRQEVFFRQITQGSTSLSKSSQHPNSRGSSTHASMCVSTLVPTLLIITPRPRRSQPQLGCAHHHSLITSMVSLTTLAHPAPLHLPTPQFQYLQHLVCSMASSGASCIVGGNIWWFLKRLNVSACQHCCASLGISLFLSPCHRHLTNVILRYFIFL